MMKRLKKILFLLIFSSFLISTTIYSEEILISGNATKQPKVWLEQGQSKGILIDIMHYVGKELDVDFKISLYPWKRAYMMATDQERGIVGLSKTTERLKIFDYSEPLYYDEVILVVKRGNEFKYETNEDLKGKTIGACRGCSFGQEYEDVKQYLNLKPDNNNVSRLKKLLRGRIEAAIISPGETGLNLAISKDKKLSRDQFTILKKPIARDPNYLGFSKTLNKKAFLKSFNQALEKGYKEGEIQKIIANY
jgi:polar amino acid transport system substrate-binding protein